MLKFSRPAPLVLGLMLLGAPLTRGWAFEPFVIKDIRVEGLQRISAGTVFNYLPLKQGERVDDAVSSEAIRALFKTGFFRDVALEREGDTLVVFVSERPAIANIKIEGNKSLKTEDLMANLKRIGFAEGRVFDRSMLDKVEQELKRQYLNLGKYGARVESTVTPEERNRVAIRIDIAEGGPATIRHINIVGNHAFPEQELLDQFKLGTKSAFAFFSDRDQYSKEKLSADLETLRSWYLDRGYINFNIDSTQVTVTPDLQHVYITINITEGEKYSVSGVKLGGDTVLPADKLRRLIHIKPGDTFSRRAVTDSANRINGRLGDVGYAFANINPVPDIDKKKRTVALTFFVDPGKRVYVRRINITGNSKTQDYVLRREMRQNEGSWVSTAQIKRSRTRIDRLGYFQEVNVETPVVPGSADQVDVDVKVKERDAFGSLNLGVGYGQDSGLLLSGSINQENFLGTGKRFTLNVNTSKVNTVYGFSFTDPYYTPEGVSRTLRASFSKTDASQLDVASYTADTSDVGIGFAVPWSEYDTFRYAFDLQNTVLHTQSDSPPSILDFVSENGSSYTAAKLSSSWSHDTRNKTVFPTDGNLQTVSAELTVPPGKLKYYKASYDGQIFLPLTKSLTLRAGGELAYGNAYGSTTTLPPFERYFAGGTRTVRGYKTDSLGPRDTNGDAVGGNIRTVGNLEVIFPAPFGEKSDSVRLSAFFDAGNVFLDRVQFGELRYSTGLALQWLTPMGPLSFSVASPLNSKPDDKTESFQFTFGTLY